MRQGPTFQLFGIPVRIDPLFLIVIGLLGFLRGYLDLGPEFMAAWVLIAGSSVLLHEMGHAVAFRTFGCRPSIALVGLGGLTSGQGRITAGKHVIVSLAGPLSTLLLVGLPAVLYSSANPRRSLAMDTILEQVIFVNVVWALFNLVPVLPLDGGQVVASLLEMGFKEKGRQVAAGLSVAIGALLVFAGLNSGWIFLTFIGGFLVAMNLAPMLSPQVADRSSPVSEAHRALVHGQPHAAERMVLDVLGRRLSDEEYREAVELLAWSRLLGGDAFGAQHALANLPDGAHSQVLYGALALSTGRVDEGLAIITWGFVNEPPGPDKLFGAIAVARAGLTDRFVNELRLLGGPGIEPLRVLEELLAYVGLQSDAAIVAAGRGPVTVSLDGAAADAPAPRSTWTSAPSAGPSSSIPPLAVEQGGSASGHAGAWPAAPPSGPPVR